MRGADRPRPAHPGPARPRADPAARVGPGERPAQGWWVWRHDRGVDDLGPADGEAGCRGGVHPGHRRPDLRHRGPPAGLQRGHYPDGPGRTRPGPRRRPQTPPPHRGDAPCYGRARRRLHRSGLPSPTRAVHTPSTTSVGPKAATPTSGPDGWSAPITTAGSTTRATRPNTYPAARSAFTDESEGSRRSNWQPNRPAVDALVAPKAAVRRTHRGRFGRSTVRHCTGQSGSARARSGVGAGHR